ncbi:MAG: hypothetical protein AAF191_03110, partial [Verrucomicrobiota bacterium]
VRTPTGEGGFWGGGRAGWHSRLGRVRGGDGLARGREWGILQRWRAGTSRPTLTWVGVGMVGRAVPSPLAEDASLQRLVRDGVAGILQCWHAGTSRPT